MQASRRKNKDFAEDLHVSQKIDDEAKRSSSRDNGKRDPRYNSDSVSKRDADTGSVSTHYMKTSNSVVSTANLNSSLSTDGAKDTIYHLFITHLGTSLKKIREWWAVLPIALYLVCVIL